MVIRGGRRAAISQIKTNVFPLEIIAVDGDQDSENGEPFEREFVPGKNLRGDAERKMAESAWLRNALEASLRPKTVRKVFLKCVKGCKLTHATFGHVYLDSRVRIWHIAIAGYRESVFLILCLPQLAIYAKTHSRNPCPLLSFGAKRTEY